MKKTDEKQFSDLPWRSANEGHLKLIITQPSAATIATKVFSRAEDWYAKQKDMAINLANESFLQQIFRDVKNFKDILHVGSLAVSTNGNAKGNCVKPMHFQPCSGTLIIRPDNISCPENSKLLVTCTNPKCKMMLETTMSKEEFWNIFLHLMIKQMVPNFPACNYINFNQYKGLEEGTSIEEGIGMSYLGLISLFPECLWGSISTSYSLKPDWWGLGFMLTQCMATIDNCDEYCQWLKFLFVKKMEQIREILDLNTTILRGPKTKRS